MRSKILTMIIATLAISSAVCVNAENYNDECRHEVSLGYGAPVNTSNTLNFLAHGFFGALSHEENHIYIGPISAEYFYHINPLVGIGAIGVYSFHKTDDVRDDKVQGKIKDIFFTIMPAVKFNWLRRENWGLYSKLGIGYTHAKYTYTDNDNKEDANEESDNAVNWQASLIGAEIGNKNIRAFAELGFGEQGMLLAGVRFRF